VFFISKGLWAVILFAAFPESNSRFKTAIAAAEQHIAGLGHKLLKLLFPFTKAARMHITEKQNPQSLEKLRNLR